MPGREEAYAREAMQMTSCRRVSADAAGHRLNIGLVYLNNSLLVFPVGRSASGLWPMGGSGRSARWRGGRRWCCGSRHVALDHVGTGRLFENIGMVR
jgi:hypothetical protein